MLSATTRRRVECWRGNWLACDQGHRAHEPLLDDERKTGEGHHLARPWFAIMIAEIGIRHDRIGQARLSLLGDQANLSLADADTGVRAIELGIKSRACLQLQKVIITERPDPGQRGVEMADDGLAAVLEDAGCLIALGQGNGDVGRQGCEPSSLGQRGLRLLLLGEVAQVGSVYRWIGSINAANRQFHRKLATAGSYAR